MTRMREDSLSEGDIPQFELIRSSRVLSNDDKGDDEEEDNEEDEDWASADDEMDV